MPGFAMNSATTFYLTATIVGLVLALQITHFWWRCNKDRTITFWAAASWMFVATDCLFTLRAVLPRLLERAGPAACVTAAHGLLVLGAQRTAGIKLRVRLVAAAVALHFLGLLLVFDKAQFPNGHAIFNRLFWSGFCFACFACLRRTSRWFWASLNSPAAVFLIQGCFLVARMLVAVVVSGLGLSTWIPVLQYVDFVNVILFDGALFISLLLALLHLRQEEIAAQRSEMRTLSGLLPVCAWCKKVRDDEGYWREITDYFAQKNRVKLTHGICQECRDKIQATVVPFQVDDP